MLRLLFLPICFLLLLGWRKRKDQRRPANIVDQRPNLDRSTHQRQRHERREPDYSRSVSKYQQLYHSELLWQRGESNAGWQLRDGQLYAEPGLRHADLRGD